MVALLVLAFYRIQPTIRDANLGFNENGDLFAFGDVPPAQNVWDVTGRFYINPGLVRILATVYGGQAQSNGSDTRLITRYGASARVQWQNLLGNASVKFNDWGPFDYHRDFNLTFPLQLMGDVSYGVVPPRFVGSYTRFGIRAEGRTLDQYSARYPYEPGDDRLATEVEIGTYINISL